MDNARVDLTRIYLETLARCAPDTAGIYLPVSRPRVERTRLLEALAASDSYRVVSQIGEPTMIAPTGNNLRDLFLIARD